MHNIQYRILAILLICLTQTKSNLFSTSIMQKSEIPSFGHKAGKRRSYRILYIGILLITPVLHCKSDLKRNLSYLYHLDYCKYINYYLFLPLSQKQMSIYIFRWLGKLISCCVCHYHVSSLMIIHNTFNSLCIALHGDLYIM